MLTHVFSLYCKDVSIDYPVMKVALSSGGSGIKGGDDASTLKGIMIAYPTNLLSLCIYFDKQTNYYISTLLWMAYVNNIYIYIQQKNR